jgi:hypothetical protein
MASRPDADRSPEVRFRTTELDARREELKALLSDVERNVVDFATETEMIRYFDDLVANGEETAMRNLALAVRRPLKWSRRRRCLTARGAGLHSSQRRLLR